MKSRGVRVDVLILQPRWSEEDIVRRQILEGVLAVVHLYRADRMKNKVSLRLFNRSGGANNVTWDRELPAPLPHLCHTNVCTEYVDLDPTTAADLVLRAKQTQVQAPPPPPQYMAQHNAPPPPQYAF